MRAIYFLYLLLISVLFWSCNKEKKEEKTDNHSKPNIIFIMSDDHGYQAISAYGHGLNQTPYIDSLATEGMRFDEAYVNNSLCAPSRASIISGKYSQNSGVRRLHHRFDGSQTTFPKQLQKAGYQTAFIGKWHLDTEPTGFDYWNMLPDQGEYFQPEFIKMGDTVQVEGYVTNLITDDAIEWLNTKRDANKPFSLLIWNKAPHRNWMPEIKYLNAFDSVPIPEPKTLFDEYATRSQSTKDQEMEIGKYLFPNYDLKLDFNPDGKAGWDDVWKENLKRFSDKERLAYENAYSEKNDQFFDADLEGQELIRWKYQRYMQDYLSTVQSIDDNVGRVMQYLKENDLDKNTIVIYTSDQGFYLGEHGWFDKRFMYEESFRTPLIVRWPKEVKAGSVNKDPVMNLDIGSTILDAAGAEIPEDMEGASFLPILKDGKAPDDWRDAVYYQYYDSDVIHNVAKHIGVKKDKYKLIYFYENGDWELYDLNKDAQELNNVYGNSQYRTVQDSLLNLLKEKAAKYDPQVKF